jgi:enamine deaminase RidA (YjgF/YER057c/UK114 family)
MSKTYLNPRALFPSRQYGFSQAVATRGKTTVYVSGQVGWDATQKITDPADLGMQTRQALENIEIAVVAAGGSRRDIVSLRLYIVGDHIHNARSVREALLGSSRQRLCRPALGSGYPLWPAKISWSRLKPLPFWSKSGARPADCCRQIPVTLNDRAVKTCKGLLTATHRKQEATEGLFATAATSHTPPWLASGWECRGRRLSRG